MTKKLLLKINNFFLIFYYQIYDFVSNNAQRLYLWYPIFFGLGIGIYFYLPCEPSFIFSFFILIFLFFLLSDFRKKDFQYIFMLLFLLCLGFNIAKIKTYSTSENSIKIRSKKIWISGKIQKIHLNEHNRYKIILDKVFIPSFEQWQTPKKLKISIPANNSDFSVGDFIRTEAMLIPLQNKISIHTTNTARNSYFEQIGGIGYTKNPPIISFKTQHRTLSQKIAKKLKNILSQNEFGIAKALILGDTTEISSSITNDYRISGISHLLAISGLHLGLISSFFFCLFRILCSFIPQISLNFNTKKISAILTLIFVFFYLQLSNFPISACRAYIMLAFSMSAILINRKALSIANVAWASMVILFIKPEALFSISFQLSFSAVFGLIAFNESNYADISLKINTPINYINKPLQVISNILIYSSVAIFFTLPISLYHFHLFTPYSLLGNLLSAWIMGIWIMPSLFVGMLLIKFSLSTYFFQFSGLGIHLISKIAHQISLLPQNSLFFPQIPLWGLIFGIFGLTWLGIWTSKQRFYGFIFFVIALLSPIINVSPDIYLTQNNTVIQIDKNLYAPIFSKNDYKTNIWLKEISQSEILPFDCQPIGCIFNLKNKRIAISSKKKYDKLFCNNETYDLKILHTQSQCPNSISRSLDQTKLIFIETNKISIPGNEFRPWHPSYPKVFLFNRQ